MIGEPDAPSERESLFNARVSGQRRESVKLVLEMLGVTGSKMTVDVMLRSAAKVEQYLADGTVPETVNGG